MNISRSCAMKVSCLIKRVWSHNYFYPLFYLLHYFYYYYIFNLYFITPYAPQEVPFLLLLSFYGTGFNFSFIFCFVLAFVFAIFQDFCT